jgi:hypothetical protein
MSKRFYWIFPVLLYLMPGCLQAQEELVPRDSIEFFGFLKSQKEVPGLSYRFIVSENSLNSTLTSDSLLSLSKIDTAYYTQYFSDFSWLDELQQQLATDRLTYQVQLALFTQPKQVEVAQEYLSDLIGKGDYLVKTEGSYSGEDFVSLASQSPYFPLERFKLKFMSDYRLLIVMVIITFFLLASTTMIITMLVMKAGKMKRESLHNEYDGMIIDPLTNLLFEKELKEIVAMKEEDIHSLFPKHLLANELYQQVLIERIIGLNKKMKGEFKEKLKALYKRLELDKVSIRLLRHRKWDRVTTGLVQINEMDLIEAIPQVKKLTNSRNFHIRSKAVAALLNLSDQVDFKFLRDYTFPLSLWQQMDYLRIIRFVGLHKNLDLGILLDSKNPSIRIFAIKLVRILGRLDIIDRLIEFEKEASIEEKIEILETYASLGAHMESNFVNTSMRSDDLRLSLAAIKAAAVIGDSESEDVIVELLDAETDFRRKRALLRSLYRLNKSKFELVTLDSSKSDIFEIRNHILDPMLQDV